MVAGSWARASLILRTVRGLCFPQAQHHQILRVGQPQLFQDRLVGAHHASGRHCQGEAELVFQEQVVLLRGDAGGHAGWSSLPSNS